MTELQLYKFIKENNIEYHWCDNNEYWDVIIFVNTCNINEFQSLFTSIYLRDYNLHCVMKDNYFAFYMLDICEYYNIDLKNIFEYENR